ncbi:hypothetical protein [Tellurirhabdus bombi]|uniref:hypothetical protein n=1 Tax=Tellurirhabdus bombi TaxID=2907205 RepID=UPI001F41FE1A|nr:hypothetical protein [Tellurirhabdus bombi]
MKTKILSFLTRFIPGQATLRIIGKWIIDNFVKLWNWFWSPVPFSIGPLLFVGWIGLRSCDTMNTSFTDYVNTLQDTISVLQGQNYFLKVDTAILNGEISDLKAKIETDSITYASLTYFQYLRGLSQPDLQSEIDREFNYLLPSGQPAEFPAVDPASGAVYINPGGSAGGLVRKKKSQ